MRDPRICPGLPSSRAAFDLISPDARAVPAVLATLAGRAALIAVGLAIVRRNEPEPYEHLVRDSLGAAIALEGFLVVYAYHRTHGSGRAAALAEHACYLENEP